MSLPIPPSGILDKDQPWYRGKISDAQWDRLKAKLTGGTDAGGTSYSKFIDCSAAEADKIIENLKKDPRGYPQMNMPGGGESYQTMIDFFQWLKDSYLTVDPKTEPENIPVEIEVVEVEQKTVDEPIVVKIEAPFEPTPAQTLSAPKRIKLPRRSGVIRPSTAKKKSAAERMAEAFDRRVNEVGDALLDSMTNPPPPEQPKERKQKEKLVKIKRAVKPKSYFKEQKGQKPLDNLSSFLGNKVKNAFGRAADARRMANEMGMPEQKKRFYFNRALGFEFGGDAIARTRGTFSRSPDATLDPSLTKQQRYMEGMFGTRTIRPSKTRENNIDDLENALKNLENKLKETVSTKEKAPESEVASLEKVVNELRDALVKNNKIQKDIVKVKGEQLDLDYDVANHKEMEAKEDQLEQGKDRSRFVEDIKEEEKEEGGEEKSGGLNFNWLKNLRKNASKWWRRIKNPKKTFQALKRLGKQKLKKIPGVKQLDNWMKKSKPLQGLRNNIDNVGKTFVNKKDDLLKWGDDVFKKGKGALTKFGDDALKWGDNAFQAGKAGITRFGDDALKFGAKFGDDAMRMGGRVGNWIMNSPIAKRIGLATTKYGGRMVPVAGTAFSAADAADRAMRGDKVGAWLAGLGGGAGLAATVTSPAAVSGVGAVAPAALETGSIIADTSLLVYDIFNAITGREFTNEADKRDPEPKLSEGGVIGSGVPAIVGEAGPEMVMRAGMNPLQSLAPMISAVREITKRVGPWGDPIESYVQQVTGPIAKQLNLPVVPTNVDIGEGDITPKDTGDRKILGKKQNIFQKMLGSLFGGSEKAKAKGMGIGMNITPNMGGGAGRTTAGAVYDYLLSKGMSENHAKGITANISRESGFKLGAHNPNDPGAGSFGLFQWNGGRAQRMMAAVPDWQTNWKGQIDYALGEDHGPRYLSSTFPTAGAAAYDWMKYWERPAEYVQAKYTPAAYEGMIHKMNLSAGMSQQQQSPNDAPQVEAPETTLPTHQHQGATFTAPQIQESPATPAPAAPAPSPAASSPVITLPIVPPSVPQQQRQQSLFLQDNRPEDPFERWRKLRLATN